MIQEVHIIKNLNCVIHTPVYISSDVRITKNKHNENEIFLEFPERAIIIKLNRKNNETTDYIRKGNFVHCLIKEGISTNLSIIAEEQIYKCFFPNTI